MAEYCELQGWPNIEDDWDSPLRDTLEISLFYLVEPTGTFLVSTGQVVYLVGGIDDYQSYYYFPFALPYVDIFGVYIGGGDCEGSVTCLYTGGLDSPRVSGWYNVLGPVSQYLPSWQNWPEINYSSNVVLEINGTNIIGIAYPCLQSNPYNAPFNHSCWTGNLISNSFHQLRSSVSLLLKLQVCNCTPVYALAPTWYSCDVVWATPLATQEFVYNYEDSSGLGGVKSRDIVFGRHRKTIWWPTNHYNLIINTRYQTTTNEDILHKSIWEKK